MTDTERVTRGDLPHWYKPGYAHFVTYRLVDSIPRQQLIRWREERERRIQQPVADGSTPSGHRERAHKLYYKRYDEYLDNHPGVRWLGHEAVAEVVRENLYHHNQSLYELLAWCILPNHVHLLMQPFENALTDTGSVSHEISSHVADAASIRDSVISDEIPDTRSPLSRIMHSLKSYTANRANELLGKSGRFWQRESYDHWVRDLDELQRIVDYICLNPVTAGLCAKPQEWKFSSAYDRFERDGSTCGLVGWLRDDWRQM